MDQDKQALARITDLMYVLEQFHKLSLDLPIQYAIVFLAVAREGEILQTDLRKKTNLTQAAVSRVISALSDHRANKLPGFDLIRQEMHPDDRRMRVLSLTRKGEKLLRDVLHVGNEEEYDKAKNSRPSESAFSGRRSKSAA